MPPTTPPSPVTWAEAAAAGITVDVGPHARRQGFDRDVVVTAAAWRAVIAEQDDAARTMSNEERRRVVVLLDAVPRGDGPSMFNVAAPDGSLVRLVAALDKYGDTVVALADVAS